MKDKENIKARIVSLAREVKGSKMLRADLAYELKPLGIEKDSIEVSKLVWEVYANSPKDVANLVASTYMSNTLPVSVVDEYASKSYLNSGNPGLALSHIDNESGEAGKSLATLKTSLAESASGAGAGAANGSFLLEAINKLSGASGIQQVKSQAAAVVNGYTSLVGVYETAKADVQGVMNNFVDVRGDVLTDYEKHVLMLTDFFGDSIKSVAPVLFNFDSVEYLNTQEMLKNVLLKYDKLSEDCSMLIGEISDSFSATVQNAAKAGKGTSKGTGLAIAAALALSHYLGASEKTARMKMELDKLKLNVKHDVVAIKGDYARLATVYKTVNDLYLPKANVYYKYSDKVFNSEFQQMVASLYNDAGVKALAEQRNELLDRRKELSDLISDHQENISYYEEDLRHCNEMLAARQGDYDNAMAQKPQKPGLLANIFTFGSATKAYNRHLYEWNATCGNVVREYENLDVSIKTDSSDLNDHKAELRELQASLHELNADIKEKTQQIMSTIKVSADMKKQLAAHLESMIKLLYVARDILESKLDERQIRKVDIPAYQDNELPEEVSNSIHSFTSALGSVVAGNVLPGTGMPSEETMSAVNDTTLMAAQAGIQLMGTLCEMEELRKKNEITSQEYDRKLQDFRRQFKKDMQAIDDKRKVLTEILKKINTAEDDGSLKNALLLLAEGTDVFKSDKDIEDFLNGNKVINI